MPGPWAEVFAKVSSFARFGVLIALINASPTAAAVFTDDLGRMVEIGSHPKRIVSMAPGITETLYALGLDGEIAGVTLFCTFPAAARSKPKIGGFTTISVEKILSLEPDLVIATADGNRRETVEKLEGLGLPVFVIKPKRLEGILGTIGTIGRITGKSEAAARLSAGLEHRVKTLTALVAHRKRRSVFFQIGGDPIITVGGDTLHHQLISLAGGWNIAGGERALYPRYSVEEVLAKQPEVIVWSSMKYGDDALPVWHRWKVWQTIPAVRNNMLYHIDTDLIDRSSPRIVEGLEQLVEAIHPEVFASKR